jgi:thiol-disulfide isomerase/thioredoxin
VASGSSSPYRLPFFACALFLGLVVLVSAGCGGDAGGGDADGEPADAANAPLAPPFALPALSGGRVSLSDYTGSVVLVNFWATWCPPCREEMPFFGRLRERYAAQGFEVLAIATDENPERTVPAFVAEFDIKFPVLLATPEVVRAYDLIGLPSTYIVSREGRVVEVLVGGQPLEVFDALVRKHL